MSCERSIERKSSEVVHLDVPIVRLAARTSVDAGPQTQTTPKLPSTSRRSYQDCDLAD
jgi:hypothetical protein